ncbi:hypothetical protein [Actinokineospora sp.]|uniref:hypothetical protein n=1 Tax=Actinokineospora sp. TaxID=1872133 RepID=UPI003D6AC7E3
MRSLLAAGALCLLATSACATASTTETPTSTSASAPTTSTSKAPRPLVPPITEWPTWFDMDDPKTGFALQMPYKVPPSEDGDSKPPQRTHKIDLSPLKADQNTLTVVFVELPDASPAALLRLPDVMVREAKKKGVADAKVDSVTDAVHKGLPAVDYTMSWTEPTGAKVVRWGRYVTNGKGVLTVDTIATGEAATGAYGETMRQYHQKVVDSARSL